MKNCKRHSWLAILTETNQMSTNIYTGLQDCRNLAITVQGRVRPTWRNLNYIIIINMYNYVARVFIKAS